MYGHVVPSLLCCLHEPSCIRINHHPLVFIHMGLPANGPNCALSRPNNFIPKSTQRVQISDNTVHCHYTSRMCDLESQYLDPDHPQNLIDCGLYNCIVMLKISSQFANNLLSNGCLNSQHGDLDGTKIL